MKRINFAKELNKVAASYMRAKENIRILSQHEELFNELLSKYPGRLIIPEVTTGYSPRFILSCHLEGEESLKHTPAPVLEELLKHTDLCSEVDMPEHSHRCWSFRLPSVLVEVQVWYSDSNNCRKVETGETRPVYRTECD